jgi:tRNA pseudouridine55 synthase
MEELPEFILVDKPKGITSFDVIRRLRKIYPGVKMGHAGTLDPRATGLMIIGLNKGTKLLDRFLKLPKTYEAEILLGVSTDSGDLDGQILEEKDCSYIPDMDIKKQIFSLIGSHMLPVPIYSAIKKNGKPLYAYAREGIAVEIPVKSMTVTSAVIGDIRGEGIKKHIRVIFDVTSGTYVRSLAEELGRRLDTPSTLSELRRLSIGEYRLDGDGVIRGIQ